MKKIILGILVLIVAGGGYMTYQLQKNDKQFLQGKSSTEYYQNLRKECEQKNSKNCCLASVERMEEIGAHKVSADGVCDYGYKKGTMMCIDSFAWCEKATINDTSKFAFYQNLKDKCRETRTDENQLSCCLDSVKAMEVVGATKLFPGGKYEENGEYDCGEGLTRMTLRCPGSYAWCQTLNNPEGENFVPVPQNAPTIKPINDSDFVPTEFNQIQLPNNVITEKECAAAGGEVWNTLGETSYNGELIGRIEGLKCPCACLVKAKGTDVLMVEKNGKMVKFTGNLDNIKTFEDCKKAGFPVSDDKPEICAIRDPNNTDYVGNTFYNNPMGAGKTCEDYTYSNCPGSCVPKCIASSCGEPDENGAVACTSDCDGEGSCVSK